MYLKMQNIASSNISFVTRYVKLIEINRILRAPNFFSLQIIVKNQEELRCHFVLEKKMWLGVLLRKMMLRQVDS